MSILWKRSIKIILGAVFFATVFFCVSGLYAAPNVGDLQAKIDQTSKQIQDIEAEILSYQKQIATVGSQATSLKNTLSQLEITRKKLLADLSLTQNKLAVTELTISQLQDRIAETQSKIARNQNAIAKAIREVDQFDSIPLIEALVIYNNISDLWNDIETIHTVRNSIGLYTKELQSLNKELDGERQASEKKKKELTDLKSELSDRKLIVEKNKNDANQILVQTKSTEANYKKILAQKQALRAAFEQELLNYESQLKIAIDPGRLPSVGSSPLSWPFDSIRVTQYFGNTPFATANPQVYNGQGHNGIDLAGSIGTRVTAAASGVIMGTGDTDLACPSASYGRWVLIQHGNGLSTLYAHLSLIKVAKGQNVSAGEVIGYSGITGYSTGPHLHFTVYATQGVQIVNRPSKVCNATYVLPVADLKAYLNPLDYLPRVS